MRFEELRDIMRQAGVVGAGGAGFPSYAKLNTAADTVILNCSECEPLLKLHRQLLAQHANEILMTLQEIADTLSADRVIIAVKKAYTETVEAVKACMNAYSKVQIGYLSEFYPAGDEVITVYETTGRQIAPGALPISVGCVVYNVETVYNVYRAWKEQAPVTHKYITVAGEVAHPCTLKAPIGMSYGRLIELAGGATQKDFVLIAGGPMTGRLSSVSDVVTKTSNAILVMPKDAYIVGKRLAPITVQVNRTMAACCQCQMCTDLCTRHALGHPIEPHKLMRAVASGVASDQAAFLGSFSCSACGLCQMYSCPQGLNPASIITETKNELRRHGITPPKGQTAAKVDPTREYRKVPMSRLTARLGLTKYDVPAPIVEVEIPCKRAKILLAQGIGAPCTACVTVGQTVKKGEMLGSFAPDKLGTAVHAPFDGRVTEVTDIRVVLEAEQINERKDG